MNLSLQEKLKAAEDKIQALETVISAAQAPSPSTSKVVWCHTNQAKDRSKDSSQHTRTISS